MNDIRAPEAPPDGADADADELLPRPLFGPEHRAWREQVRRFVEREIVPHHRQWEHDGRVPRELWPRAGAQGMLCGWLPEADGGPGGDLLSDFVVAEELARAGATGPGFALHSLIVAPYLAQHGTAALRARLLPAMVAGHAVGALAMTEPGTGSDVAAIRTRARPAADGSGDWIVDGQKTFITNGLHADAVVVACRTGDGDGAGAGRGAAAVSLLVLERGMPGFTRGRALAKIGQHAQDTAELFFDGVRVPGANLLGEPGRGFGYLMQALAQERLLISVQCQARAEAALRATVAYVRERRVFGQPLSALQNTRFVLAARWADLQAGRAYCDRLLGEHLAGRLDAASASAGKLWHAELLGRVVDDCVQLHGGHGYMADTAVARAYVDARVERIYGGTAEIMKEVVARRLLDGRARR